MPAAYRREWDFTSDGVRRSLEESLERLGLDRIDVVYVHDPDDFGDQVVAETLPALARMRDEGIVGAIGAGMNQSPMLARFVNEADIDVVMVAGRFTLLDQSAVGRSAPRRAGTRCRCGRGRGLQLGTVEFALRSFRRQVRLRPGSLELIDRARAIASVCERHGVTVPEAAIAFVLRHPAVVSVVVGARTREQVTSNVDRFSATVPDALWLDLAEQGLLPPGLSIG